MKCIHLECTLYFDKCIQMHRKFSIRDEKENQNVEKTECWKNKKETEQPRMMRQFQNVWYMHYTRREREWSRRNIWINNSWEIPKINDRHQTMNPGSSENGKWGMGWSHVSMSYSNCRTPETEKKKAWDNSKEEEEKTPYL